ncbi:unnamed protein product [Heligmosomoides polygyrus]|uniref:DAO domain-containing protein n=1 Tax=Heligmosomoides polygyrus TaxID=6339 RepID=A0A183FDG3_HELPZ|nr:unnamed protein product [Heligmosomoides polygyrus]
MNPAPDGSDTEEEATLAFTPYPFMVCISAQANQAFDPSKRLNMWRIRDDSGVEWLAALTIVVIDQWGTCYQSTETEISTTVPIVREGERGRRCCRRTLTSSFHLLPSFPGSRQMIARMLPRTIARNTNRLLLRSSTRYESNAPPAHEFPQTFDIVVVGGGIVGSATARQLKMEHPKLRICMVEKENKLCK